MPFNTISEVAAAVVGAEIRGDASPRVSGFSTDSRTIKPGEVFIALRGENFDGHAYIDDVAAKGAAAAVVERAWSGRADIPLIVTDDPLKAFGQIAREHRRTFEHPVVAVAGSNGKTTTKELVAAVLSKRFGVLKTTGNLNNLIGVPTTMLRIDPSHSAAVVEIGTNMPGEIEQLCEILEPTHGIITNIGREHLELLGSIEGVAEEEGKLFRYLESTDGVSFVNADDAQLRRVASMGRTTTYGFREGVDVRGEVQRLTETGTPVVRVEAGNEKSVITMKLPGIHSATNALAATAIGLHFGLSLEQIRTALEEFEPLEGASGYARLAPVRAEGGALILNDTYNANPDSMVVAFETLSAMTLGAGGRRIVVLGDMRELGASSAEEHTRLGEEIARAKLDGAYFYGTEMKRAHDALAKSATTSQAFDDKSALIDALKRELLPQDVVLVKGSRGTKMEEVVAALRG